MYKNSDIPKLSRSVIGANGRLEENERWSSLRIMIYTHAFWGLAFTSFGIYAIYNLGKKQAEPVIEDFRREHMPTPNDIETPAVSEKTAIYCGWMENTDTISIAIPLINQDPRKDTLSPQ